MWKLSIFVFYTNLFTNPIINELTFKKKNDQRATTSCF